MIGLALFAASLVDRGTAGAASVPAAHERVLTQLKHELKRKGWSYRRAAARLNRSYQHLSEVLNGHRTSLRLLRQIRELEHAPKGAAK